MADVKEDKTTQFVPPKKSFTTEFWVGVFALFGLGCFAYLAINIANIRLSSAGFYNITAQFDSVSGLKVGAPVEIAGVEIGEVSDITLDGTAANVSLRIRDGVKLRDDDIAAIRTKGIIGDRYVKLVPGGSKTAINGGGKISDTESAVEFEEVIGKLIHRFES
ncbi:MAG: outer membrane lipid asymmetry maintenance protein MlaD [Bdellovibrionota bacterium]